MRIHSFLSTFLLIIQIGNVNASELNAKIFHYLENKDYINAQRLANSTNDIAIKNIVLSQKFLKSEAKKNNFSEIVNFLRLNPQWPSRKKIIEQAELSINHNTNHAIIYKWFCANQPLTANGYKYYAIVLPEFINNQEEIAIALRKGWIRGNFTALEEKAYFHKFSKYLRASDHAKRIDEHLWRGDVAEARRSLHYVDNKHQHMFKAEIAAIAGNNHSDEYFAGVAPQYYTSGLFYRYLKYKEKQTPDKSVLKLFGKAPNDDKHGHEWWRLRAYYGREFMKLKDFVSAYKIVANHSATAPADISDAEFLSGWLALRFLKKPDLALKHFEKFMTVVKQPMSLSRGSYWLGRTYDVKGDKTSANKHYKHANEYIYTYYGQLANIELRENKIILKLTPKPTIHHHANLEKDPIVRAAKLLIKYNKPELAKTYAKTAMECIKSPAEILLLAELIKVCSKSYNMVEFAKSASHNGVLLTNYAYPTPYNLTNTGVDPALTYAIIRQESVFNQYARSPANAFGLMQLIEGTARANAKDLGLKFDLSKLTQDSTYNIKLGTNNLKLLLKDRKGSYILSIASYNADGRHITKWTEIFGDPRQMQNLHDIVDWIELVPFYETRNYLQRVFENIQVYRAKITGSNELRLKQDLMRGHL